MGYKTCFFKSEARGLKGLAAKFLENRSDVSEKQKKKGRVLDVREFKMYWMMHHDERMEAWIRANLTACVCEDIFITDTIVLLCC